MDTNALLSNLGPHLEQARLTTGDFHLGTIPKLHVQPPGDTNFHVSDEVEIENLPAIGTEKALRIKALFETCQRASEKWLPAPPCEPHVVALGSQQTDFAKGHKPAAGTIPDKDLLQCFTCFRRSRCSPYS